MLKKVNNYIYSSILISIIFIILGIIFIINPSISFDAITISLTSIFILNGIILLIIDFQFNSIFMNNFLHGILSLIIGFILLIHPETLKIILPFIIGIWFIMSSLFNLKFSIYLKNESPGSTILTILMVIASIICGFILISKPMESIDILTMTLGITLLIHSISNIIDMLVVKKYINKIVKEMKKYILKYTD